MDPPDLDHARGFPHGPSLEHAKRVAAWILKSLRVFDGDRRGTAVLAMHDQVLEHHVGMVVLAEHRIFGPAVAVLRPMVETYLRGVWLERLTTPEATARFLASEEPLDADALLRVLRKAKRLHDAGPVLAAWEASPLHRHPLLPPQRLAALPAPGELDSRFIPGLDEVIDALVLGTSVALLSTIKIGVHAGNPGLVQAARFRLEAQPRAAPRPGPE
jgi:hypothetical protein